MTFKELSWHDKFGHKLHARCWECNPHPKAVIGIVHGQGEHLARYDHVADFFTSRGYAVMAIDHVGHGKSEGKRGHAPSYETYMEGVGILIRHFGIQYTGKPAFLYGHSMGGNFVLNYALRHNPDVKGVIASGPWLRLAFKAPAIKVALAKMMSRIYPAYSESNGLDANDLSHDPQAVKMYIDDPLVHDKITAKAFLEIHQAGEWALENASKLSLPILVMHGTEDKLTSCDASEEFVRKASGDVTFKGWEGLYHEIHNELQKEEVMKYTLSWIEDHM